MGIDEVEHAETGYDLGTLGAGIGRMGLSSTPRRADSSLATANHNEEVSA